MISGDRPPPCGGDSPHERAVEVHGEDRGTDGVPVVAWSLALDGEGVREGIRVYRVWAKANLGDAEWSEVGAGGETDLRFFCVTIEMP